MAQYQKSRKGRKKDKPVSTFRRMVRRAGAVFSIMALIWLAGYLGMQGRLPDTWMPENWKLEQLADKFGIHFETPAPPPAEGAAQIHIIDVGQGDAALLRQGDSWALIDAGTAGSADKLVAYLQKQGVKKLDVAVMTHAHADHMGGMPKVLENFPVEQFILPDLSITEVPTSVSFERTLEQLEKQPDCQVITASAGNEFAVGEGTLKILFAGIRDEENANNASVATMFEAAGARFLATGDGEEEYELAMVAEGISLRADIFKAAHHGSSTSNSAAFLWAVRPDYVAVSCGKDNDYGHPHQQVTDRYIKVGAEILRTDMDGTIVFEILDGDITVRKAG